MDQASLIDVFVSYAGRDGVAAMRVYDDLARSGLTVWRYEEDGEPSVDFMDEIRRTILRARHFCLLDSPHARASKWVRAECELAIGARTAGGRPAVSVCAIVERVGPWGDGLFEKHDTLRAFDLDRYEAGIRALCLHLGTVHQPGFSLPRDRDFETELFAADLRPRRSGDAEAERRRVVDRLLGLYREFRELHGQGAIEDAEAQLRLVRRALRQARARSVVSADLALAEIHAQGGRDGEAAELLEDMSRTHEGDARVWAGLGGARFRLGTLDAALAAWRRCEILVVASRQPEDQANVGHVRHNLARVLVALGRPHEAVAELDKLASGNPDPPYVLSARGAALLRLGEVDRAIDCLAAAFEAYRDTPLLAVHHVVSLADAYRRTGRREEERELYRLGVARLAKEPEMWRRAAGCHLDGGAFVEALDSLERAAELAPDRATYRGELALMAWRAGDRERARTAAEVCVELEPRNARDRYYRGLAFHLLGKLEIAAFELERARRDPQVARWAGYETLP